MILYHGTGNDFEIINPTKFKQIADFGPGFYLSDNYSKAEEWAKRHNRDGIIMAYEIEDETISNYSYEFVDKFEWLKIVLYFRELLIKGLTYTDEEIKGYQDKEILVGPILDNNFFIEISKIISFSQLTEDFISRLELGNVKQYRFNEKGIEELELNLKLVGKDYINKTFSESWGDL